MTTYSDFLGKKTWDAVDSGFIAENINPMMYPFQQACVKWACKRGKAALFEDTGLGKTVQEAEFARLVHDHTRGDVLILAPLCVAQQTVGEAEKFGIDVNYCRNASQLRAGVNITNYEMIEHFESAEFAGIVLDESSILKSQTSKIRQYITDRFQTTPYRLSCTATPSPNDYMELGNQSEFLGIMKASEMLSMFFTHDGGETSKWRLKGHGKQRFWEWLATWAICIKKPSDIGFDDANYNLPPLNIIDHVVESSSSFDDLLPGVATTLTERRQAKKESMRERIKLAADIANNSDEGFIIWCHLNDESTALSESIPDAVEVTGSMSPGAKEKNIISFTVGESRAIVSKPSIAGFGMNWQHCRNQIFAGINDSWEEFYQAIRRSYRFGQHHEVNIHVITSSAEAAVLENIRRKQEQADDMSAQMIEHMKSIMQHEIHGASIEKTEYKPHQTMEIPEWLISEAA